MLKKYFIKFYSFIERCIVSKCIPSLLQIVFELALSNLKNARKKSYHNYVLTKTYFFLNTCFKLPAMHGDVSDVGVRRITNCKNSPFGNLPLSITHPNHNIKEKLKIKNYDRKHDILNFTLSAS